MAEPAPPKLRGTLRDFVAGFIRWRDALKSLPHPEVAQIMLDESGYTGMWQADKSPEAPGRLDNLKELVSALAEFDTLPAFLEHVSLVLEATDKSVEAQVSLMTDIVFLPGWEEEIFPSRLSLSESGNKGLEEERRLAYVGITRAKVRAFISHVANRQLHGSWVNALPSRFIGELPAAHIDRQSTIGYGTGGGFGRSYGNRWQEDKAGATPSLWEQLRAGQNRTALPPRLKPAEIEGRAAVVPTPHRAGKLNIGDRVFHEKFGTGTVRRIDHDKLEIDFDKAGLKKVLETFVRAAG